MQTAISRVQLALQQLKQGKMIILTDHPDREDEGDLIFPAEIINQSVINFMIRHCSGIICMPILEKQIKQLGLEWMVPPHKNSSLRGTPFTVSIEAKQGVTTGVSAHDRAKTILTAVSDGASPEDVVSPGHVFPLWSNENGVLERAGHTEGAVDLVRLAGFKPAAVLCEIMNPDGSMMRGAALKQFSEEHQLMILSIDDLIAYRLAFEDLIEDQVSADIPLEEFGLFEMTVIKEKIKHTEHIILKNKKRDAMTPLLVRVHSSCTTGDLFQSKRCDCHQQLQYSLKRISEEGGMLIYLKQEGRGIGLFNKIKAYSLQQQGMDTIEANEHLGLPIDSRQYYIAANILRNHKIEDIRLLTNNPSKVNDLKKYGIKKVEQIFLPTFCNEHNKDYLNAKKSKLNHVMNFDLLSQAGGSHG